MGQVAKPGSYDLEDNLSLTSLLSNAGTPTETAALSKAYILRNGQRISIDLRSVIAGNADPALTTFHFTPGDVLVIPENQTRFAVLGQVGKPGTYSYPDDPSQATILNVLTTAGGPVGGNTADLSKAGIVRNVNGQPEFISVNLTQLLTSKRGTTQTNVRILPNDILYIPSKGTKTSPLQLLGPLAALGTIF